MQNCKRNSHAMPYMWAMGRMDSALAFLGSLLPMARSTKEMLLQSARYGSMTPFEKPVVLDVVRVEKGRWQDDHILIIGHLATLKGDQMKNRNVQIPYELFFQLLQYFLMENYEGEEIIRKGLEKKLNAMVDRELYSKYKTAPTEEEREKSRQEYLERKGIPENFRW